MLRPRRTNEMGGGYIPDWQEREYGESLKFRDEILFCSVCGTELYSDGACPNCEEDCNG